MDKFKLEIKEVIAIVLGIVLFFTFDWLQRYSMLLGILPEDSFSWCGFKVPVLIIVSAVFGPIVGVVTGIAGAILVGSVYNGDMLYYAEIMNCALVGFVMGIYAKHLEVKQGNFRGLKILDFNMILLMIISLTDVLLYPMMLLVHNKNNLIEACKIGMKHATGDFVIICVVGTLILLLISRLNRKAIAPR